MFVLMLRMDRCGHLGVLPGFLLMRLLRLGGALNNAMLLKMAMFVVIFDLCQGRSESPKCVRLLVGVLALNIGRRSKQLDPVIAGDNNKSHDDI